MSIHGDVGVRGGRSGGLPPPRAGKFSGQTLFSGQALIAKILNDKIYFNTGEKFQGNSVFQGKLLKNPEW